MSRHWPGMALARLGMALARDGMAWHWPVQIPISRSAVRRVDEFKHGFAVVPAGGAPVVLQVSTHGGTHSPGTHSSGAPTPGRCTQAETEELVAQWTRAIRECQDSYVGLESFELLQVKVRSGGYSTEYLLSTSRGVPA